MKYSCRNGGFTLAELLVTITILVLLTAFLVPIFTSVIQDSRQAQDETKFESVCTALKSAMTEPGVQKEVISLVEGDALVIVGHIDSNGKIVFGDFQVLGHSGQKPLNQTLLWQYAIQYVGERYSAVSGRFANRYIVFTITQKTDSTTAQCEYVIVKNLHEAGL